MDTRFFTFIRIHSQKRPDFKIMLKQEEKYLKAIKSINVK